MQGSDSETEDEHGLDEGDEAQLFQQRREGQPGNQDTEQQGTETPAPSDERHKIGNQVITGSPACNFSNHHTLSRINSIVKAVLVLHKLPPACSQLQCL